MFVKNGSCLMKSLCLAIILCVIANFVLGNIVFAKNIVEINNKDVEKIKTGLDLIKSVVNFTIKDDKLKTILNTTINIGDTSTDITYGLLVLTTFNEMELIDLVVSQRYKTEARDYFNSVLDERLSLMNYYTGIGYDLPRIISGSITGPVSALTLNAFSITNKVIDIFIALENIKTVKLYNGLWFYFDLRKGNESHKIAWEEAKIIMSWGRSNPYIPNQVVKNDELELEFITLYEEWEPYVTINKGVNEQYKKNIQKELQNTIVTAYENYEFVEKENQPSFAEKARISLNNLLEEISKIPVVVANTGKNIQKKAQKQLNKISLQIQRLTAFLGDKLSLSPRTDIAVKVEEVSEQLEQNWDRLSLSQEDELSVVAEIQELQPTGGSEPSLDKFNLSKEDIQEIIDDISERLDIIAQEVKELRGEEVQVEEEFKKEIEEEQEESTKEEEQELNENIVYYSSTSYSPSKPVFLKILITEVQIASENNQKDDFVELYNPSSEDIDLTNWYIQRKTKTASNFSTYVPKSLFSEKTIKAHDYFLIANASSSSSFLADVLTIYPLTKDNVLVLKNPNRAISDKVGWGQAQDFETASIKNPLAGQSIGRKWSTTSENYIDSDNNSCDFEIQEPTPRAQNKSKVELEPELEPEEIKQTPSLAVVINEIAWMGTASSMKDEWIELYNNTEQDINLNNWILSWSHGTTTYSINFSTSTVATTTIPAHEFYLMERTDDDTISDVFADWIDSFGYGLNNQGEKLELKDDNGNLIDIVDCSSGWFAGENQKIGNSWLRISMERINSTSTGTTSTNWASNNLIIKNGKDVSENNIYGTPKAKNSVSMLLTLVSDLPFDDTISEFKLTYPYSPYLVTENLFVPKNKTLFIEQGVIIKFCQDCELIVEGVIQTPATGTEEIIFTSYKDDDYGGDTNGNGLSRGKAGDWKRIYFKNSFGSELNNVLVKYGGQLFPLSSPYTNSSYLPIIHIKGGNISIKNATISDAFTRAIWLDNSTSTISDVVFLNIKNSPTTRDSAAIFILNGNSIIQNSVFSSSSIGVEIQNSSSTIKNCVFSNNSMGIEIESGNPSIENNTFENNEIPIHLFGSASPDFINNYQNVYNNTLNGILVASADITSISTWKADLPYVINMNFTIIQTGRLILQPGVIVKFNGQKSMNIYGEIITQGASSSEVIFTSLKDDDYGGDTNNDSTSTSPYYINDWYSLRFSSSSSVLDGTIIRYGGTTFNKSIGAVAIEQDVDITIQNSIFEKNRIAIVYKDANCTTTEQRIDELKTNDNVVFQNNYYDFNPECTVP